MAAQHSLYSLARLNSRLPGTLHYSPPSKESKGHSPARIKLAREEQKQDPSGSEMQTDNLIEELEELVAG